MGQTKSARTRHKKELVGKGKGSKARPTRVEPYRDHGKPHIQHGFPRARRGAYNETS